MYANSVTTELTSPSCVPLHSFDKVRHLIALICLHVSGSLYLTVTA